MITLKMIAQKQFEQVIGFTWNLAVELSAFKSP